jgi:L-ascorbate metabolism protein UlaG (beta-lactamase superfamily)
VTMTGTTPLEMLNGFDPPSGTVGLAWLGQAGFVVRGAGVTALLDPFLSPFEGRLYESSIEPERARNIDVVLCTHEHVDHFDAASAPAPTRASPGAVFVVPTPILDMVTEVGISAHRVVGLQPGAPLELGGLSVCAIPAMHGVTMEDAYGFGEGLSNGLIRFLGYVVDVGGVRIYHAGDTILYDGMEDRLRELGVDVAMLPINGRDPEREARDIVGNLSEREAAWLAAQIGTEVLLPMHYDLFAGNRGYPAHVVESIEREHPGTMVLVPGRDVPFLFASARSR